MFALPTNVCYICQMRFSREFYRLAACALLLAVGACYEAPQESAIYTNPVADEYVEFHPAIDEYVHQKYTWALDVYHIEFQRQDAGVLVFWVIHSDDRKITNRTGGGKSFEVWLDPTERRVMKELGFQ